METEKRESKKERRRIGPAAKRRTSPCGEFKCQSERQREKEQKESEIKLWVWTNE